MFASFHPHSMWGRWPHGAVGHMGSLATWGRWPHGVVGHMGSLATWGRWPHGVVGMSVPVIRAVCRSGGDHERLATSATEPDGRTDPATFLTSESGLAGRELSQSHRPARRVGHLRRAVHPFGELLDLRIHLEFHTCLCLFCWRNSGALKVANERQALANRLKQNILPPRRNLERQATNDPLIKCTSH
jgi:hypothetical protein